MELDLAVFKELVPVELFGRTELPSLGEEPYRLILGPYVFYWLALQPQQRQEPAAAADAATLHPPTLIVAGAWEEVFRPENKSALEKILPDYIAPRRWFGSKARAIQITLAILQGFVANRGDAWRYTLEALERYFERVLSAAVPLGTTPMMKIFTSQTDDR